MVIAWPSFHADSPLPLAPRRSRACWQAASSCCALNDHVVNEYSRDSRSAAPASRNVRSSWRRAAATSDRPTRLQMIPNQSLTTRKIDRDSIQDVAA